MSQDDEELVKEILRGENLGFSEVTRLSGGQVNSLYRVDESYVVRVGGRPDALAKFLSENELFHRFRDRVPFPQVLAFGRRGRFTYQVQRFVMGESLAWVWTRLDREAQRRVARDIAKYLRILHSQRPPGFGYVHSERRFTRWSDFWQDEVEQLRDELGSVQAYLPQDLVGSVISFFDDNRNILDDSMPSLVHGDLWPGNIIVRGGEVAALLDLESAMQAPFEYELVTLESFCLYPNDYEFGGLRFTSYDYSDLITLLKEFYPEIFLVKDIRRKLDLYHVVKALRSHLRYLKSIPRIRERYFPINPVAKVTNFLFEEGVRAF